MEILVLQDPRRVLEARADVLLLQRGIVVAPDFVEALAGGRELDNGVDRDPRPGDDRRATADGGVDPDPFGEIHVGRIQGWRRPSKPRGPRRGGVPPYPAASARRSRASALIVVRSWIVRSHRVGMAPTPQ